MAEAPIWPVATDALIADTTHLTDAEFGAYMRLMIVQWRSKGQPLEFNPAKLARLCGTPARHWPARWAAISEFFDDSQLPLRVSQKRVVDDYKVVSSKIAQARSSGAHGGAAKALKTKGRHLANATVPLDNRYKQNSSDPMKSANSGRVANGVADAYQSINHEGEDKEITTPNPSFDAEPADGPEPGGGFSDQDPKPTPETQAEDLTIGEVEHIPKPREPWAILGADLLAMTRLDEKPKPISTAICAQWLRDWSEDDIRAAISDAVERESYDPHQVGGLKYFEPAIKRHIEQRHAANRKEITDRVAGWSDKVWISLASKWRAGEMEWAPTLHGPAPDQTGFMGPASVAGPRVRIETTGGLRWDVVGLRVLTMAGMIDKAISIAPVKEWMDAGVSGEDVLAAVKGVVEAPGYRPPKSLREFEGAVMARQEAA